MDSAISKKTGDRITAMMVFKDPSYLSDHEWISPVDEISNWEEIKHWKEIPVHFVKEHQREHSGKKISIRPFFAFNPNSPAKSVEESEEHKKIKNWIFNCVRDDSINFVYSIGKVKNYFKISQLEEFIDWNSYYVSQEETIKGKGLIRSDINIQFKKQHPLLGNGIIIEIQLSPQSDETISKRTYDRACKGFSTAWLFEDDFIDIKSENIELIDNDISIRLYAEEIYSFQENLIHKIEEMSKMLEQKNNLLMNGAIQSINNFSKSCEIRIHNFNEDLEKKMIQKFNDEFINNFPEKNRDLIMSLVNLQVDKELRLRTLEVSTRFNEEIKSTLDNLYSKVQDIVKKDILKEFLSGNIFDNIRESIKKEVIQNLKETFEKQKIESASSLPFLDELNCSSCNKKCYSGGYTRRGDKYLCMNCTHKFDYQPVSDNKSSEGIKKWY